MSKKTRARSYAKGIGDAVANRTVNRKVLTTTRKPVIITESVARNDAESLDHQVAVLADKHGVAGYTYEVIAGDDVSVEVRITATQRKDFESWGQVADRVALGNSLLAPETGRQDEYDRLNHHLRQASVLLSGRHLQHGDATQPGRNIEVFTNCATSASSFVLFYLLLNGSGVGRAYDDSMMLVDWTKMPIVVPVIDRSHPDVRSGEILALESKAARHLYAGREIEEYMVPDSREGWAHAVEVMENMAFYGEREKVLLINFSEVRHRGEPIVGMQHRPASGPGPLMNAIRNIATLRDAGMKPWRATMFADHYLAECVLVGGARRAARMATKSWRDADVLDFAGVKRGGFLWSSNNSITVDEEFWELVRTAPTPLRENSPHAVAVGVFKGATSASYYDGTGEPGFINQDRLVDNKDGMDLPFIIESPKFQLSDRSRIQYRTLALAAKKSRYRNITNPCGEIVLDMLGGYCVIGDVVPFHAKSDDDAEDAFRTTVRALIRTNLMPALYQSEVKRTNRIGVSMTGIHEYAWTRFGCAWADLVDFEKSKDFWLMLSRFKRAVRDEAQAYSKVLGLVTPHTDSTIKPAGTTSKLFGLSEGAHLPAMREYLRWVQFRHDDPLVAVYKDKGYPVRKLVNYGGTTIVGFPTQPTICSLGMGSRLVTAAEATPEEQYKFLQLLERYWITGVDEEGVSLLPDTGNQVSYTLKYDPAIVDFAEFERTLLDGQSKIRCCSVMPKIDGTAYEYQPEQPVTKAEFEAVAAAIAEDDEVQEEVAIEHVDCSTGACPIDFKGN